MSIPSCSLYLEKKIVDTILPLVETLDRQGSDRLDFHEVSVNTLRELINTAYQHGYRDGRAGSYTG